MNNKGKETFSLSLSVSNETAETKDEAAKITTFETRENISLTTGVLTELFTKHLQSANLWTGPSKKEHYSGMTGVMMDFDGEISISGIEKRCSEWHYVIYTSTSHRTKGDDRFRVILPIDPETYDSYKSPEMHKRVYESVLKQFPEIDKSCTSTASKFFPFCGDMVNFEVKVHEGKDYWTPDFTERYVDFNTVKGVPVITLDTVVLDANKKPLLIRDITEKTQIFCPFCDPEERHNPDSHNAAVYIKNGVPSIYCSSCESRGRGLSKKGVYPLDANQSFNLAVEHKGVIVFRDIISDKYYLGEYSKVQETYCFHAISKQNISNALIERGITVPDVFPEMEFQSDFTSDKIIDMDKKCVNRYVVPKVLSQTPVTGKGKTIPKYTDLLTKHICGNDPDVYELLINHQAYIVQNRVKTRVAFLFQGTQGTGKGIWFNFVLASIFGRNYCADVLQKVFVKEFNMFLENNICILVDEVEANFSETNNEITRVLKQVIADTYISIEGKGVDIRNGKNNANIFFATNKRNGVHIEPGDRRFIVASRQENKVYDQPWWTDDEDIIIKLQSETEEFVAYLKQYPVDMTKINRAFDNAAKQALIDLSKTNADYFFEVVKEGNWEWLNENIVPNTNNDWISFGIQEIVNRIKLSDKVSRDDLNNIYNNISGKHINPASFTRLCKLHGLEIKQLWIDGENKMGVEVKWNLPDTEKSKS